MRRPRSTGDPNLDRLIDAIIEVIQPNNDRDLLREILVEGARLAGSDVERLDLKIVASVLREMRQAFAVFAPYRGRRKVTVFGSARTAPNDPLYGQARDLARKLAERGWMIVTGAGPGIMEAAMEGAGRANSIGVRIRLPFETDANEVIAGDDKLVAMKYFFTRKLMLMKESAAYVAMPGGFGTLDETMELLTLQQTGKAVPAPLVLLDLPGGDFWQGWQSFMTDHVARLGYVSPADLDLAHRCDDHLDAVGRIEHFYRNYRSIRWVDDRLVIRLATAPSQAELAALNARFAWLTSDGSELSTTGPLQPEIVDDDDLGAARIVMRFNPAETAGLHELIHALNELGVPHVR